LRILDLTRERRHVVPAVIRPQGTEHGGAESGKPAARARRHPAARPEQTRTVEVAPIAGGEQEGAETDTEHQCHLRHGDHEGGATARGDGRAIDERHGPDGGNRREGEAIELQFHAGDLAAEVPILQRAARRHIHEYREADRQGRLRTGAEHGKCHPAEQKADEASVGAAQVHIVAARLRHHCGDLRVGECPGEGQQPGGHPHQQDDFGAAHVAGHDAGFQKDAGADHVGDVDGDRRPGAHAARQLRPARGR